MMYAVLFIGVCSLAWGAICFAERRNIHDHREE